MSKAKFTAELGWFVLCFGDGCGSKQGKPTVVCLISKTAIKVNLMLRNFPGRKAHQLYLPTVTFKNRTRTTSLAWPKWLVTLRLGRLWGTPSRTPHSVSTAWDENGLAGWVLALPMEHSPGSPTRSPKFQQFSMHSAHPVLPPLKHCAVHSDGNATGPHTLLGIERRLLHWVLRCHLRLFQTCVCGVPSEWWLRLWPPGKKL